MSKPNLDENTVAIIDAIKRGVVALGLVISGKPEDVLVLQEFANDMDKLTGADNGSR